MVLIGAACALAWMLGYLPALAAALIYLAAASLFTFALFAMDKRRSGTDARRFSETNLLLAAWLGGGAGAWLAMKKLRHKTKHKRFQILVPLACLVQLAALIWFTVRVLQTQG